MDDKEFLEKHIESLEKAIKYFGSQNKEERERFVVRSFLENAGIPYVESDVISPEGDPPDVEFKDARFEVKELLDSGRKRHDEYKHALEKARSYTSAAQALHDWDPHDIGIRDLVHRCGIYVEGLEKKYPPAVRASLDLLLYVNLEDLLDILEQPDVDVSKIAMAGWRSVSFVEGKNCGCFYAGDHAPAFIRQAVGKLLRRGTPRQITRSGPSKL